MNVFEKIRYEVRNYFKHKLFKDSQGRSLYLESDVIDMINKVETKYNNGWIPCSERLPDAGKRYLVTGVWKDGDFEKHSVYDAVYGSDGIWHTHNYAPVPYAVIAWQPLHQPYCQKNTEPEWKEHLMRRFTNMEK